jgi:hypothetical protein
VNAKNCIIIVNLINRVDKLILNSRSRGPILKSKHVRGYHPNFFKLANQVQVEPRRPHNHLAGVVPDAAHSLAPLDLHSFAPLGILRSAVEDIDQE